jgi:PAS domain S-box-containing protein
VERQEASPERALACGRDALTVAAQKKRERPKAANRPAVFLEEISELPLPLQLELLRFLEDDRLEPMDSSESSPADIPAAGVPGSLGFAESHSQDGVILLDADGNIAHLNEIAARVIGVEEGEAKEKPFASLASTASAYLQIREELRRVAEGQRPRHLEIEAQIFGRQRAFLFNTMPLFGAKFVSGILLILHDMTGIRAQYQARINLIATLSHELRAPLTSISLAVQLLEEGVIPRRKLIKTMLSEFSRLSHLAQELINLTGGHVFPVDMQRIWGSLVGAEMSRSGRKGKTQKLPTNRPAHR